MDLADLQLSCNLYEEAYIKEELCSTSKRHRLRDHLHQSGLVGSTWSQETCVRWGCGKQPVHQKPRLLSRLSPGWSDLLRCLFLSRVQVIHSKAVHYNHDFEMTEEVLMKERKTFLSVRDEIACVLRILYCSMGMGYRPLC